MGKRTLCLAIILGLAFSGFSLIGIVKHSIYDKGFFMREIESNGVCENTEITYMEMSNVTNQIQDFLKGNRDNFNIYAEKGDENIYAALFTQDEITYMEKARQVGQRVLYVRFACGLVGFFALLLFIRKDPRGIAWGLLGGCALTLVLLIVVGVFGFFNFDALFGSFEKICLPPSIWKNSEMMLPKIVTTTYFLHLGKRVFVYSSALYVVVGVLSGIYLYMTKKEAPKRGKTRF